MSYITSEDLKMVRELIINKDVEACGYLLENKNELSVFLETYGEEIKKPDGTVHRGLCQTSKYTRFIWHTHSSNLIAYPSPEDLIKVLKDRGTDVPQVSVMFSKWGIWEVSNYGRKYKLNEEWIKYLQKIIGDMFVYIYKITDRGRGDLDLDTISEIMLVINAVNEKMNSMKFMESPSFLLTFTPWESLEEGEFYFLK